MKAILAAAAIALATLAGCAEQGRSGGEDLSASFDGGVLRVRYPTEGHKDILMLINRDGTLAGVTGGATSATDFRLSRSGLEFSTQAVTSAGVMPMRFALEGVAEGAWVGEYEIGGGCASDCLRTGAASWDRGGELVDLPDS